MSMMSRHEILRSVDHEQEFLQLMLELPMGAGLPVAAKPWRGKRTLRPPRRAEADEFAAPAKRGSGEPANMNRLSS